MPLILQGITVQGSVVASRYVHMRMLDFAARHKIEPIIEKFPMTEDGIKEALDRLSSGNIRYRGVVLAKQEATANGH